MTVLSDDTVKNLLSAADKVAAKPVPPNPADIALELHEVIGKLQGKGMSYKQILAWLKRRGYTLKSHHISVALRRYRSA